MSRPWMPLYVADYLADTQHLTTAEHGAYLLLIMHYWANKGLPNDDARLARIVRMTPAEWRRARAVLVDLFDPEWRHARIDAELAKADEISDARRRAAEKKHNKSNASASANAEQMHTQSQSQPQSQKKEEEDSRAVAVASRPCVSGAFSRFRSAYPRRKGANPWTPAENKFALKVKAGADPEAIIAGAARYADECRRDGIFGTSFVAQALVWLNQDRWTDYAASEPPDPATITFHEVRPETPEWSAWWDFHGKRQNKFGSSFGQSQMVKAADTGKPYMAPTQWPPGFVLAESSTEAA